MSDVGNTGAGSTEGGTQGGQSTGSTGAATGATGSAANTGAWTGSGNSGGSGSANTGSEGGQTKTFSEEYVKELRGESAKYRTELSKTNARLKELEDAQLSETEKLTKRAKELEEQNAALMGSVRKSSIESAATAAGAIVPAAIAGLIPADAADITEAVNAVKKAYPALFKPAVGGSADAGGGTSGSGGKPPAADMNTILRKAAGYNV